MKIGIMTFWWNQENYGQILQLYALRKFLAENGYDPILIRYDKRMEPHIEEKTSIRKKITKILVFLERKFHSRGFESFKKKNIYIGSTKIYSSIKELQKNPPQVDIYMVGSDQVWNYNLYENGAECDTYKSYFLDFGDKDIKRVSYASSWGLTDIPKEYVNVISPLIARFSYVSVREHTGVALCEKCGYSKSEIVNDPVFLLRAQDYRDLYEKNAKISKKKKYIFLYILSDTNGFNLKLVYEYARKNNLDVCCVTNYGHKEIRNKIYPKIEEWLALIDNAECVITNSFHCSAFSIILHKKFGVISLSGKRAITNIRFKSLFESTNSGNHFITDSDFSNLEKKYKPVINNNLNILNILR